MPPVAALLVRTLRPYALHAFLLVYTPLLLIADGVTGGVEPQIALGLATFAVLGFAARRVDANDRSKLVLASGRGATVGGLAVCSDCDAVRGVRLADLGRLHV